MKCLVFAYSQLGYDCLGYLIKESQHQVIGVFTHEDQPSEHIWFDSVAALAKQYDLPVWTAPNLSEMTHTLVSLNPDVIFSFYYRHMIPENILKIPPLGAFNMHGSLLPKYRGRCPVNWALIHGEKKTGVTLHAMTKTADAGDIIDQESILIEDTATAGDVMTILCSMSVTVLRRCIDAIAFQKTTPIPQDHSQATYFGGRQAKDGEIDWHNPARDIHNLVRALLPIPQYPGAFGKINGHIIRVVASRLIEPHHALEKFSLDNSTSIPGTVVQELSQSEFIVTCGDQGQQRLWIQGEHYR